MSDADAHEPRRLRAGHADAHVAVDGEQDHPRSSDRGSEGRSGPGEVRVGGRARRPEGLDISLIQRQPRRWKENTTPIGRHGGVEVLDQLVLERGAPGFIRCHNGPEITANALHAAGTEALKASHNQDRNSV
jgi:hypothetical protein